MDQQAKELQQTIAGATFHARQRRLIPYNDDEQMARRCGCACRAGRGREASMLFGSVYVAAIST